MTVGAGWTRSWLPDSHSSGALVLVGAERRVSRRTKFIAETYVTSDSPLIMAGVRLIGKRASADLVLCSIPGGDDPLVFPLVNVVWTFGHR